MHLVSCGDPCEVTRDVTLLARQSMRKKAWSGRICVTRATSPASIVASAWGTVSKRYVIWCNQNTHKHCMNSQYCMWITVDKKIVTCVYIGCVYSAVMTGDLAPFILMFMSKILTDKFATLLQILCYTFVTEDWHQFSIPAGNNITSINSQYVAQSCLYACVITLGLRPK